MCDSFLLRYGNAWCCDAVKASEQWVTSCGMQPSQRRVAAFSIPNNAHWQVDHGAALLGVGYAVSQDEQVKTRLREWVKLYVLPEHGSGSL